MPRSPLAISRSSSSCLRGKNLAAVVRSSQNLHQMQSQQNNTCCISRQKISHLSLQTHEKAAMACIPVTSFIEFLVQIYKESHSCGYLLMMSISAIHISYNSEQFIRCSCKDNKKISDSFTLSLALAKTDRILQCNQQRKIKWSCRGCRCWGSWTATALVKNSNFLLLRVLCCVLDQRNLS